MKHSPLIVLALLLLAIGASGQEEPVVRKNDVGFSTQFFNNSQPPYLLMYKRMVAPAMALRVGMAVSITTQRTNPQDNNTNYSTLTNSSFAPSLGLEWQKSFAKNFTLYFGADFRYSVYSNKSEIFTSNILVRQIFQDSKYYILSPLLGLRYNIIDQLYVATEVNLNLGYFESTYTNTDIPGSTAVNKSYGYQAILQPAVGLFFFYRF